MREGQVSMTAVRVAMGRALADRLRLTPRFADPIALEWLPGPERQRVLSFPGAPPKGFRERWRYGEALAGARVGNRPPKAKSLQFVPVDFTRDALDEALTRAGHDPSRPTTWIWEGVGRILAFGADSEHCSRRRGAQAVFRSEPRTKPENPTPTTSSDAATRRDETKNPPKPA
ncbi:MAG TPA: class I SAM-dependent methyltransferase [Polyangiaceae bacterium]|nr:class I SAM-dependent methyltransferase [Polyangiaceae bacterium]